MKVKRPRQKPGKAGGQQLVQVKTKARRVGPVSQGKNLARPLLRPGRLCPGRPRCPDVLVRRAVWRARGVLDLPDLPAERDHVGGVPDELDRGRLVQGFEDDAERAVPVHLHEAAGVRRRRSTRKDRHRSCPARARTDRDRGQTRRRRGVGAPEATSVTVGDFGLNDTTLPTAGRWGTGPASAM